MRTHKVGLIARADSGSKEHRSFKPKVGVWQSPRRIYLSRFGRAMAVTGGSGRAARTTITIALLSRSLALRRDGGIGIHSALKQRGWLQHLGSSPSPGTGALGKRTC